MINPIVYLVSGLRWTFLGTSDFPIALSFGMTIGFLVACIVVIALLFKTGWRLRE
jgi:ABC-2 type transport system permease protein